jgi:nitroreductase
VNDVFEIMQTARAVRRYRDEPVDDALLEKCLQAATWAPSGGNQQPWRFVVLKGQKAREIIGRGAQKTWESMTEFYGLNEPDPADDSSKGRVIRAMHEHMMNGATTPVLVLFCVKPQPGASELENGGSIFPALQNFSLAARAQGLGMAVVLWHRPVIYELREAVGIPDDWKIAAIASAGWPKGSHGPVNRKPVSAVVAVDRWDQAWPSAG